LRPNHPFVLRVSDACGSDDYTWFGPNAPLCNLGRRRSTGSLALLAYLLQYVSNLVHLAAEGFLGRGGVAGFRRAALWLSHAPGGGGAPAALSVGGERGWPLRGCAAD